MLHGKSPLQIDTFVTHVWNEEFERFTATFRNALKGSAVVWICSFALNQHTLSSEGLDFAEVEKAPL